MDEIKKIEEKLASGCYLNTIVIKHLLSYIKELEERQKWIDEVGRPQHPDDERPWCAAYLDCRARIEELEDGIAYLRSVDGTSDVSYFIDARRKLYKLVEKESK